MRLLLVAPPGLIAGPGAQRRRKPPRRRASLLRCAVYGARLSGVNNNCRRVGIGELLIRGGSDGPRVRRCRER